ncbi:serine hydrolase domain-containing protein [Spongiimicrobium salis]|uniref:serine hydrolase domain-containing protein n=1 Tax=Spongiimicrobium salis TaxID=1667022 RepID=UPI00374DABF3
MKKTVFPTLFIAVFLYHLGFAQDYHNTVGPIQDSKALPNTDLVKTLANAFIQKTGIPGFSIAVSKNDTLQYAQGFGYSNLEDGIKMTPTTRLRAASVSKLITVTALGRLLSQEKVDLDAPIKKYIPYIDAQYANLTSRQLAGHTSGLDHRPRGKRHKKQQFIHIKPMVELMDKPLLFESDTSYKYSTHGFVVLGAVIEGASGVPFETYMQEAVFKALDMTQTIPEDIKKLTANDSEIYYVKKGMPHKQRWTNTSYNLPGAGFRSTPTDLLKMMCAYTNGFISKEVVTEMFRSHKLKNGEKTNVGISWRNSYDTFGHRTIEHAGNWLGARTVIVHYPEENMNIAIMLNAGRHILIEETAHIFAELFREWSKNKPVVSQINTHIELRFRSKGKVTQHHGNISLKGHKGVLNVDFDGFLKSNELYYLGHGNHYAVITDFGLAYLSLTKEAVLKGDLFLYGTLNTANPTTQEAKASFRSF